MDSRSLSVPTIASRSPPPLCELKIERGSKEKACLSGRVKKKERKSEGVHVTWKPKEDYGGISKKETKEKGVDGEKEDDQ